ncbi:MAG: ECF transporter S component [Candidatus Methanosuratus sp.]|nr:ECF transporter S component [Candidatus Methanosuratincola sp.]
MLRNNGRLSRTQKITYTSLLIALAAALRLVKYALFGPVQFINFPGIFTILGGILFGLVTGGVVGVASYVVSDIIIGAPGPWTAVNCIVMGIVGFGSGIIWSRKDKSRISKMGILIGAYIIMFAFDVVTSWTLFVIIGWDPIYALVMGVLGLFIPTMTSGGWMVAVGPITEFTTASLIAMLVQVLAKNKSK